MGGNETYGHVGRTAGTVQDLPLCGLPDFVGAVEPGACDDMSGHGVECMGEGELAGQVGLVVQGEEWPGALNADGTTAPPFVNQIDGTVYDGALIVPTWAVGWVPSAVGLCGKGADYKPAPDPNAPPSPEPEPTFPEIGMYFTAVSAVSGTITGSIYNFQTGQSQGTQAAGILSNVSNVVAPFLTS